MGVILTVMANPALDVTYRVDRLAPTSTHRVHSVHRRAGGKGANVARVVRWLGHEVRLAGPVGGVTGDAVRADLVAAGVEHDLVPISGETRRTVTVVSDDDGRATVFNEPGPDVAEREWSDLVELVERRIDQVSAVVFSGSLPGSAPDDVYARLMAVASTQGIPTVLDTSGPALRSGVLGGPDLVKPNAAELHELTGLSDPEQGARALRDEGARNVVVSLGREGLLAVTGEGTWRARPSEEVFGNPTGAGDALVAALTVGMVTGEPWPERLREAVAVSAAAVAAPVAGDIDQNHYRRERVAAGVRAAEKERDHAAGRNR